MLNIVIVKLKDYKNSLPMIIVMTVMALALVYIFGKGFESGYTPSVAVVDNDRSQTSESYIKQVMDNQSYEFTMVTLDLGLEQLEQGDYIALVEVGQGFEAGLLEGESKLVFYKTGNSIEHQTLRAMLESVSRLYMVNEGFVSGVDGAFGAMGIQVDKEALHERIKENRQAYPIMDLQVKSFDEGFVGGYDAIKHSFMGYLLFFSMFTMVFGVGSIVEERENRVWQRQIVSPVSGATILAGNMIASFIVGMLQLSIMLLVSKYAFGIDYGGNMLALLAVLAVYVIAITCLGLLLSNIVKTSQQLGSFSPLVIVGTSMIGGCMWPLSIIKSEVLLFLADLTPQRWAYQGLNAIIVNNGGFSDVLLPIAYLLIITVVLFLLAMIPHQKMAKSI